MADYKELDELLSDLEAESIITPKKDWSLSEIDALLGDDVSFETDDVKSVVDMPVPSDEEE